MSLIACEQWLISAVRYRVDLTDFHESFNWRDSELIYNCLQKYLRNIGKYQRLSLDIYYICAKKGVMNQEIKFSLSFWHLRGHHIIRISCKFQNWKRPC